MIEETTSPNLYLFFSIIIVSTDSTTTDGSYERYVSIAEKEDNRKACYVVKTKWKEGMGTILYLSNWQGRKQVLFRWKYIERDMIYSIKAAVVFWYFDSWNELKYIFVVAYKLYFVRIREPPLQDWGKI